MRFFSATNPYRIGPGLSEDLSSPSYKRALEFEAMGCVMRYAQNSFPSLSTPSLDRLLELSPRAPFLSPRSHQPALRFCLIHHHSGTSGFLLQCAIETPTKRSSVGVPRAVKVRRSPSAGSNGETMPPGSTLNCREVGNFPQDIVGYPQIRHCMPACRTSD